ncbi:MAG: PBP1A family penicillin-binding protein [Selenomonadaceae bacterium]|nr:PBP1A family penicillin-binding protein [Selenomonadaceae bacterium]
MSNSPQERGNGQSSPPKKKSSTFLKIFIALIIFIIVMAVGVGIGFVTANINAKTDLSKDILPPASSHIYDSVGNEIAIIHATENRVPVKIEQIPANLQHAFIAIEDNRFYEHNGVDPRGLLRAIYTNIVAQEIAEGGSTITQQLAKNAYLTQDRTYKRKIQEMFLALQLEKQYTKQEILELYLNQIYFGQGAYGVQAAAKTYFGKNVEDLNLAECAMLAGIPKSPNYYSPFNNINAAMARRDTVLDQMVTYGYINRNEAAAAKSAEMTFAPPNVPEKHKDAMYFIEYVTQLLVDRYGADAVYKDGLKVYTTIDLDMQRMAEEALLTYLPQDYTDANGIVQPQGAIVAIEPSTGYIRAMVGGRGTDQFNRATMAERQPGSAFKPFVFIAALENNYTPDTVIEDSPITIAGWSPQNDSRRFSGNVTLRTVATFSMNVPTVKIAYALGMDKAIYYAQEMGITTFVLDGDPNDTNLATSLGGLTRGVTPLEIASAYGTFAYGGVHMPHIAITKVLDRNGNVIHEAVPEGRQVVSAESAADLTTMLEDVINKGTGKGANIGRPAAGKTGTTSEYKDAWFVGYTPDLVAAVWIGNDDNTSLDGIMGGGLPATIWSHFMQNALLNVPAHDFDDLVVERRNVKSSAEPPPSNNSQRRDYYEEEPQRGRYYEPEPEPTYREPEPTYREPARTPEPDYTQKPEGVPDYTPEPEPTYTNPEPTYREPEPIREPEPVREPEPTYSEPVYREPEPVIDNAPTPGEDLGKGRN